MLRCAAPGSPVMLSQTQSPTRKTRYTLEMVQADGVWVGVNTHLTNTISEELIRRGLAHSPLSGNSWEIKREATVGNSRLDFMLTRGPKTCYVEAKNVTLTQGKKAIFPDAVTKRGVKHLRTLMELTGKKTEACILYIIQRSDCSSFAPAREIDPVYAETLAQAIKAGVKALAYGFEVKPEGIWLLGRLPVQVDG